MARFGSRRSLRYCPPPMRGPRRTGLGATMRSLAYAILLLVCADIATAAARRRVPPAPLASAASPRTGRPTAGLAHRFRLEHALTLRSFSDLTWSHDGTRLAFVATEVDTAENTNNPDIWLVDLERGEAVRLTRHPKGDTSPTFSPGGDTIAFVATRATGDDAKASIYMMSLRGGEPWA